VVLVGRARGSVGHVEDQVDDAEARMQRLEQWASEHARPADKPKQPVPLPEEFVPRSKARARQARQWMRTQLVSGSEWLANRVLDRGIDTAAHATLPEHAHPERLAYLPSGWHVLPRALRHVGASDHDTFVDFGCGKGRVVHQAARRPFRKVIGVEISPALAEVARTSLAARSRQHRCRDVEIVVADAAHYQVPDDLTIAYFFHPFYGETFDAVMRNIVDSLDRRPRRVSLIYVWPLFADQVLRTGRFRLVKELRGGPLGDNKHPAKIFESC
jgi:SAM-dependent methyltransferase